MRILEAFADLKHRQKIQFYFSDVSKFMRDSF